jgi:hypothetical protein
MLFVSFVTITSALAAIVTASPVHSGDSGISLTTHQDQCPLVKRNNANAEVPTRCDNCHAIYIAYRNQGDCRGAMNKVCNSVSILFINDVLRLGTNKVYVVLQG